MATWLSVIMPTYNGEKFLVDALESVLLQSAESLEVIAVDDGSTDRTVEILRSYAGRLNLRVLPQERSGSWIKMTNIGIREARGEYVSFLHQDDLWQAGRIRSLRVLAEQFPSAVALLHSATFIDESGAPLCRWRCPFPERASLIPARTMFERLLVQNFIAIPAPAWKRAAFEKLGPLDEKLWFTADWKLWLGLARLGNWAYSPEPLAAFRIHPAAQTLSGATKENFYRDQYENILAEFLPARTGRLAALATFSSDMNQFLAARFHRRNTPWAKLALKALSLGPVGWYRYFYYSRIAERVLARLRVQLRQPLRS